MSIEDFMHIIIGLKMKFNQEVEDSGTYAVAASPVSWCERGDLNPHEVIPHKALNLARLPIPPLSPMVF